MKNRSLTLKQYILVAGTLFGMFFGAGNLIFPVHLGQEAGRNAIPAMIGFIITAVGIPVLGVAAIGSTHSEGLQELSEKVGKKYGYFFTCVLYLTIGPFFAIPRCATTSFTTGILPLVGDAVPERAALLIFALIFFAFVLFFSLRPGNITLWIGKIINPVFLIFLAVLVFSALLHPAAPISAVEPTADYQSGALFSALVKGYGTMDAIAGLAFGIIVVNVIRGMGVTEGGVVARDVLRAGVLTGALMALIYVLTILMGAQSRGLFPVSENGGVALAQISGHYLGGAGKAILAVTITFACLKTSVGLVTSCAETFVRVFPKALSYRGWTILFTGFSFGVSNIGLSLLLDYAVPVLMFIYPPAIALIILSMAGELFGHDRRVYVSVMAFTWCAAVFDFLKSLPAGVRETLHLNAAVDCARRVLPFFDMDLGWVVPALIGLILGLLIRKIRPQPLTSVS